MKRFKRFVSVLLAILILSGIGTACKKEEKKVTELKVGVCAGPYGDMFAQAIEPSLVEKGYTVTFVEFSDYVQPNNALANKEIDLNLFQHSTYLKKFSEDNKLALTFIVEVPTASMGIFSDKVKSFDELQEGATVAIPNDATNLSRALRVLQQAKLVTINPSVDAKVATENDLSENPKNLKFVLIEAPQLPRTLDSAEIAVINGNYALSAGLNLTNALYVEELADGYVNGVAVRTEDVDAQFAKDVVEIVKSDAFKKVIDDPASDFYSFQRPKDY